MLLTDLCCVNVAVAWVSGSVEPLITEMSLLGTEYLQHEAV